MTARFLDLNPQQERGLACVVCFTPYDVLPPIDHVPVGVGQDGGQVFACDTPSLRCAYAVGYVPPGEQLALGGDSAGAAVAGVR